jgi:two-component system chemotaxis response regulator CheY
MKFLVVDDSATMRHIVVSSLGRIGYGEVVEAVDGLEALAKFDASVDFVITDGSMPNMGGAELARALRRREDGRMVPILLVTARNVREDVDAALAAGVSGWVAKPFTPQVLKQRIAELTGSVPAAV